jgi:thiosulfate/3-mercaptopyruvate sulfurtransferase
MSHTNIIDVNGLQGLIDVGAAAIIDCRFDLTRPAAGLESYLAGHIPGAVYADLNRDLAARPEARQGRHPLPSPADFVATLRRLGVSNDSQVIAYDDANGSMAARLWWMLRWVGHERCAVLDGGFRAWSAASGAIEIGHAQHKSSQFVAKPSLVSWVSTEQVLEALKDSTQVLVDARAAERFAGRSEPIDPIAGHVPGALNHPFTLNLNEQAQFLPREELRRRWQARLDRHYPTQLIAMCGSGVTACHNLLALDIAGLGGARLYAGSWSEWIRDPSRPVATGTTP